MTEEAVRSGLYSGTVFHRRLKPRAHFLRYRVFMVLIDLDEWEGPLKRLRWLTADRFGWMSLRLSDYGDRSGSPLKTQIETRLKEAGIAGGGRIQLLTLPRILGYAFNPLSVYFCHDARGALSATLYEVSNTFGGRHTYLMPANADGPIRQTVDKAFHVSPFMDMDLSYRFAIQPPHALAGEGVAVSIAVHDAEGPMLLTGFSGARAELTDANLRLAWFTHPLLTLKVIAGIHWEAVKLLAKGLRLRGGVTPDYPVTVGGADSPGGVQHA